ncbi:peptidase M48 family protein [Sphingomonas sp. CFBP 13714]|uniref:M48 family metallopeptidase n=1 Tax=Sphingomonas sp. CFBP 13714 TaxID=2775308 RepID=UPI00177DF974|nr:M48 family metallopeptidase [Sphingomonas sp. CFBP 13714]MBD8700972.1 peptidase M48 family protein [Sphingomonas sp. CFBP 13714]
MRLKAVYQGRMSIVMRILPAVLLSAGAASAVPPPSVSVSVSLAGTTTAPAAAPAQAPPRAFFEALRAADLRLATIGYRLTSANAALCDRLQPQIGMPIHALNQYSAEARPNAIGVFGFETRLGVEAVVADGPAARAGVRSGDSIQLLAGKRQPGIGAADTAETPADRDAAEALIAAQPPGAPIAMTVLRDGRAVTVSIPAVAGCRSRFEILLGSGLDASADGAVVQIGEKYFEGYSDAEIAVIVAHELAHNILRHRDRLDAAKISRGLMAELGRNGRLIRQTEDEADRLSVYLLANAGYDPRSAPQFWREKGGTIDGGLFRSRTHASSKARATALDAVVQDIARRPERPILPADVLALRTQPLR